MAQDNVIRSRRLSVSDGLSSNYTTCILQDSKGFIWIGTREGLNKYDGNSFRKYYHRADNAASLPSDVIEVISEDSVGFIWIATDGGGLARLNRNTDIFTIFQHSNTLIQSPANNRPTALHVDACGRLWIGYYNGELDRFEPSTQSFLHLGKLICLDGTSAGYIRAIHEDRTTGSLLVSGSLWTTVINLTAEPHPAPHGGLVERPFARRTRVCMDPMAGEWLTFTESPGGNFNQVRHDFLRGNPLHRAGDRAVSIPSPGAMRASGNIIYRGGGRFWLPVSEGGLTEINVEELVSRQMIVTDGTTTATVVDGATTDRSGSVWFATRDGVFVTDNHRRALRTEVVRDPERSNQAQSIRAILFDHHTSVWAGAGNGSLFQKDAHGHYVRRGQYSHTTAPMSINGLIEAPTGKISVAATRGPWFVYDPESGPQGEMRRVFQNENQYDDAYDMELDSDGTLWCGGKARLDTAGYVLARIDYRRDNIERYDYSTSAGESITHAVWTIMERDRATLWVGTAHGLFVFDKNARRFVDRYHNRPEDVNSLSCDNTWVLHRSRNGKLWVGTWGGGMNCLDEVTRTFSHLTEDNGLSSNYIRSILEDSAGNLWIATSKGISCFNPDLETIRNYSSSDGLLDDEFEPNSCAVSAEGEFFFGGTRGITRFFPMQLLDTLKRAPFVFTAVRVFGAIRFSEQHGGDTIRLSHGDRSFSVEYAVLDFRAPDSKKYEYMLDGLDVGWISTGARTDASFNNIGPGTHVLRVRVISAMGTIGREEMHMVIIIAPPWWGTWWARMATLLSIASIVGWVVALRNRRNRALDQLFDEAREDERLGLAGELHDGPLQNLYAARFFLPAVGSGESRTGDAGRLDTLFRKALTEIQGITGQLQMPHFDKGLAQELLYMCEGFQERHQAITLNITGIVPEPMQLPIPVMQNIYRIVRTAITNVGKHSDATVLVVEFAVRGTILSMRILDNGRGFVLSPPPQPDGGRHRYGLLLMRSYAKAIGAELSIRSAAGEGTEITVIARI